MIKEIEKIEEIIEYYAGERNPKEQENLVAMLREIQEVEGYIPKEAQEKAAEKIGIKTTVLSCITQRYPSLKGENYGHEIVLCSGARCGCKGGPEIIDAVKKELKIGKDGISANRKVHVVIRNCLKQCKTSPNMMIDGKLYSGLTVEKALEIVRKL